jgi:opacity protein-like surface antigen
MQIHFLKKYFFALCFLFFFGISLSAQTYSNKVSSILSFTGGLTSSNLINDTIKFRSGIMYTAGLSYCVMISERLNVGVDVLYTGKAFKYDSPVIKFRHFYVDIPLYAQINLTENVRVNAGFQYSIATNSQMVTIDPSKENGVNVQTMRTIKPTDYGVLAGLEFDINKLIGVGARYSLSASTFLKKNETNFGVFQLSFKYSPIKTNKVFFHKKDAQQ